MNPISTLFGAGVALRNALYRRHILKSHQLSRPVVSVGNLSVGGTGKTPFVIMLGGLLKQRGIEFDVLSRGYGRKSKEVLVVDPEGSPEQFGDEPLLMARKLQAPVVVGADRFQAGLLAESRFPQSRMHILDDGFQHLRVRRDFDIVLLSDEDFGEPLLPVGRLREPLSSLERADAVVLASNSLVPLSAKSVWRVRRSMVFLQPMTRVVAFCGIARPHQFFSGLRKLGMDLAETLAFPDHHRFSRRDVRALLRAKQQTGAAGFITTDKDAVNLGELRSQLHTFETAGLEMELEEPSRAIDPMLRVLEIA
jgi:tetraacyldisaccharide 4'-kinase